MIEILEKIKGEFQALREEFAKSKMKFGSVATVDGVVLNYEGEELVEGSMVTLEDGTPAPDGEHSIEGNKIITVVDGAVTAIVEAEEPAPVQEDFSEKFAAVEGRFEALEKSMSDIKGAIEKLMGIQEQQMSALQEFAAQEPAPAKKPIQPTAKEDRLANFAKALKNNK
jgi:quercetin dioxygenase-like cupin family protein